MTIGIPRALMYYKYRVMWETFFLELGIKIFYSPKTSRELFEQGNHVSIDEACLPSKVFMGHLGYLAEKCDYVLVSRLGGFGEGEDVCVKFNATIDLARCAYPNMEILELNIDIPKGITEKKAYLSIGKQLHKSYFETHRAYKRARIRQRIYELERHNKFQNTLFKPQSPIVMIVAHPYNALDEYIGQPIERMLKDMGAQVVYAFDADPYECRDVSSKLSETLYWTFNKVLLGALGTYSKDVDGIVFLTAFPCGPDSLVNELAMRHVAKQGKPYLNIVLDDNQSETGLQTRIESFIDILTALSKKNA